MDKPHPDIIEIALNRAEGSAFERFFHGFYSALLGRSFIPMGGIHDGGADAFLNSGLFGDGDNATIFYQASVQKDHRSKIRNTVNRILESERKLEVLVYVTSQIVGNIDKEEDVLQDELGVVIKIRDQKWIINNINDHKSISAFNDYLGHYLDFLEKIGNASTISHGQFKDQNERAMCVFLGQEVERRRGETELLESVTDSLILWALDDTDPGENRFMSRENILKKIENVLPSAKHFIRQSIDNRINLLSQKGNSAGREVRWYKKDDKFCLPFNTRRLVREENLKDVDLKNRVTDIFRARIEQYLRKQKHTGISVPDVATLCHRAIEFTFEKEGLEFVSFLSNRDENPYQGSISDRVDEALEEMQFKKEHALAVKEAALDTIRQAFYKSTKNERIYFGKLSRTFTLLFTLRNEPRIVEYFRKMSSKFMLFIGTDIIIRALSERYLAEQDQMTVNMLRILHDAGSTLILTDDTVNEIHSHLKATNNEFRNYYEPIEDHIDQNWARHSDRILIRAYFYAKLDGRNRGRPTMWKSFVRQICDPSELHTPNGRMQIKNYLQEKFSFQFVSSDEMDNLVDSKEVDALSKHLAQDKKHEELAVNDARQVLAVYGKRKELKEYHNPNPYGYKTWWMTQETVIRKYTADLVKVHGSQYIMRPEFILNFISLSPSTEEVRRSYEFIFPTILGVRLSNRMREEVFDDVLKRAGEVRNTDPARCRAMMADMSNKLKGDLYKQYETNWSPNALNNN